MELRERTVLFSLLILSSVIADDKDQVKHVGDFMQDFLVDSTFKILIPARTAECFYSRYAVNTTAYVSYEVVDGGDRKIDFSMKDIWKGKLIYPEAIDSISDYKEHIFSERTVVQYCFKNYRSSFQKKLLSLGMYRSFYRQMTYKDKEEEEMFNRSETVLTSFGKISDSVRNITMSSSHSSIMYIHDFMAMRKNRDYVQYWAIFHVILILGTSLLQVYFLRHFFRDPSGGRKPRV